MSGAHFINDLMTTGIVAPLLPLYKSAFHLSYFSTSLIVLVSYLTSSIMQPLFGLFTDKYPRPWLLSAGVVLSCLGLALTGAATSFGWVLVFIGLSGLGSGAFHPEASRGAHLAAGEGRGIAQSIFQVGGNLGQAFGPAMLPLFVLARGLHALLWFLPLAVIAFAITIQILPWYRKRIEQERANKQIVHGRNRFGALLLLTSIVILRSWCQIGVAAFLPFYYKHHGIPYHDAFWLTFVFLLAGAIGTFIGGVLSDKLGRKWIVVASMVLSIPFAIILPHTTGLFSALDLFGFGFTVLSSFAVTVVYGQSLLPRNLGLASGLMIGLGVGAGGVGATVFGAIADVYGVPFVLNIVVILPILAGVLAFWLPSDKKMTPASV